MKDVFEMTEEELDEKVEVSYRYIKSLHTSIKAKSMANKVYVEMLIYAEKAMQPLQKRFEVETRDGLAQAITQELDKSYDARKPIETHVKA